MIYQVVSPELVLQAILTLGISVLGGIIGMWLITLHSAKDTFGDEEDVKP